MQKLTIILYVCDSCQKKCQVHELAEVNDFNSDISRMDENIQSFRQDISKNALLGLVKHEFNVYKIINNSLLAFKDSLFIYP